MHQVSIAIMEAEQRHGPLTPRLQRALIIIAEEFGELAKNVADYTRAHEVPHRPVAAAVDIIGEAAQLAAMCVLMIENILNANVEVT